MHEVGPSYELAYDFPTWKGDPLRTYMLATIPRSGSTFVASELWRTGVLGAPMEYLNFYNMDWRVRERFSDDHLAYWRSIISRRTSPNGVFSYKMFVPFYEMVSQRSLGLLKQVRADFVIYLQRRDDVRQVVSYARAMQTGAWFAESQVTQAADVETADFVTAAKLLLEQRRAWSRIFQLTGTQPLEVFYEDFLQDSAACCQRVSDFIGVEMRADASFTTKSPRVNKHVLASGEERAWIAKAQAALSTLASDYHDVFTGSS